jgi:Tfp pilus assembly protein FimV
LKRRIRHSYPANMIRSCLFAGLLLLPLSTVRAADDTPAAIAEREAAEEREKRINARMEDMEKTIQSYDKRMSLLNDDLRTLREEINKLRESNNDSQTRGDIKKLKDAIEEVDKKRLEDNKKVLATLEDLKADLKTFVAKTGSSSPTPRTNTSSPTTTTKPNHSSPPKRKDTENGYEYTISDGDTLPKIIAKLRSRDIKITQKQMMDANPGMNWNNLQIGKKLFVPAQ